LLVDKTYHKRPPYGIIHYEGRDFSVEYTRELEASLLDLLVEMKKDERKKEVHRTHEQVVRCKGCGFRDVCDQSLA
jgi:CRISPR-associated exonuclease Cas4